MNKVQYMCAIANYSQLFNTSNSKIINVHMCNRYIIIMYIAKELFVVWDAIFFDS